MRLSPSLRRRALPPRRQLRRLRALTCARSRTRRRQATGACGRMIGIWPVATATMCRTAGATRGRVGRFRGALGPRRFAITTARPKASATAIDTAHQPPTTVSRIATTVMGTVYRRTLDFRLNDTRTRRSSRSLGRPHSRSRGCCARLSAGENRHYGVDADVSLRPAVSLSRISLTVPERPASAEVSGRRGRAERSAGRATR